MFTHHYILNLKSKLKILIQFKQVDIDWLTGIGIVLIWKIPFTTYLVYLTSTYLVTYPFVAEQFCTQQLARRQTWLLHQYLNLFENSSEIFRNQNRSSKPKSTPSRYISISNLYGKYQAYYNNSPMVYLSAFTYVIKNSVSFEHVIPPSVRLFNLR